MNQHHLAMEPTQHLFQRKKCPVHSLWADIAGSQCFHPGVGEQGEVAGFGGGGKAQIRGELCLWADSHAS